MKNLTVLCTTIVLLSVLAGCQKEDFHIEESAKEITQEEMVFKEGQMIMGEKLENPYSVENMQKAYDSLQLENQLKAGIKIKATHLYVRFRPKNHKELDIITRDTTLDFYDYPLDVEIKKGGTHYHDPEIPTNEITWQYTVVPIDYKFRGQVKYEKLAKLYLPEKGDDLQELKSTSIEHFDWLKLETEALRITNNLEEETEDIRLKSTSWRPKGTIKVWDDIVKTSYSTSKQIFLYYNFFNGFDDESITLLEDLIDDRVYAVDILPQLPTGVANYIQDILDEEDPHNHYEEWDIMEEIIDDSRKAVYTYETNTTNSNFMPLEGVEVRARRWFTTHTGYTDANGNFTCDGTFTRPANYSIKWERWDFDIRDGSYGQAYFNGPKFEGDWNLNIEEPGTPKSFLFAHIFRAAYTYYYKNGNWGIESPPERDGILGALNHRLHIAGKIETGRSSYITFKEFALAAQVTVKSNNGSSEYIFGTTIHELAHASHWELGYSTFQYGIDWVFNKALIPESWAECVEHVITSSVYGNSWKNLQRKTFSKIYDGYTPLFIDLIDDHNQRDKHNGDTNFPIDRVYGYTISQLEDVLDKTYIDLGPLNIIETTYESNAISIYKALLKSMYNNPSEQYIDELFNNYH